MKKRDVFVLLNNISSKDMKELKGAKFQYAISKNKKILKDECDIIRDALIPKTEKYNEFNKKRIELLESFSKKDDNGKPIIKNNMYDVEDMDAFNKEAEKLKLEYKETLDEDNKNEEENNKLLDEEIDIDLIIHNIKQEHLPDDINGEQMDAIVDLVE